MKRAHIVTTSILLVLAAPPAMAADDGTGITHVTYSESRIPTLTCSTIYGCEVILQTGDRLRFASLMDDRWTAKVTDAGSVSTPPRILIAPSGADQPASDSEARQPLRTSLHALAGNREYVVNLVATSLSVQHRIVFQYDTTPAIVVRAMDRGTSAPDAQPTAVPFVAPESETPPLDPARMDFGWKTTGAAALRCVTVFSYGNQLWCKMPADLTRVPNAYYSDGRKDLPLNAHVVAQRYLVVDGLTSPVALEIRGAKSARAVIERARE
jgi:hypothetical protein